LLRDFLSKYQEDQFSTYLIVPTQALARQLISKLMEECGTFDKHSIITMDELAKARMASSPNARYLVNQFGSEAIIRNIMSAKKADLPLFTVENELRQGLVPEVRAFISSTLDFKSDYPAALGSEITPKSVQLSLIRDTYLNSIHVKGYIDQHELLSWASTDIAEAKQAGVKNLFFYGIKEPKPIERDFISALCAACPQSTYYLVFSKDNPVFHEDLGWLNATSVEDLPETERDHSLFTIFCSKDRRSGAEIQVGEYADARAELRAVGSEIRGLLDEGVEPERIAILLPMRRKAAPLVREIMEDFQIPANVRVPVAFSESVVAQTVLKIIDIAIDDFRADDMAELLSSPCVRFQYKYGGESKVLTAADVKSLAKKWKIAAGKEKWIESAGRTRYWHRSSKGRPPRVHKRVRCLPGK